MARLFEPLSRVRERGWGEGSFSGIAGEASAERGSALQVGITGEASAEHGSALPVCGGCW